MTTADETWLTPYEDMIVEGSIPEVGVSVLIGVDMATGKRTVSWGAIAGDHNADLLMVVGALETVKQRVLEKIARGGGDGR